MAKAKLPRKTTKSVDANKVLTGEPSQNLKAATKVKRLAGSAENPGPFNLEAEIRRRAYELWEQCGRESGHENEHWLMAEQEVRGRHAEHSYSA